MTKVTALGPVYKISPIGPGRAAASLVLLTRKEADALSGDVAARRIVLIGEEGRRLLGNFTAFVERHRPEIESMRARYRRQGRRKPVPGCHTWEEVVRKHFQVSYFHMSRLLAALKERKRLGTGKAPKPETPEPEPQVIDVQAQRVSRCQETAVLLTKKEKRKIDGERREPLKTGTKGS